MASLEITQSRARRQTPGISKPGWSVSGNFSESSRQVLQQFADVRRDSSNRILRSRLTPACAPSATILVTARAAALLSAQRGAAQPGYGLELRSDSVRLSFEYFTFLQAILHAATWFAKSESSRGRRRVAPPIRPLIHQSCGPGCDAAYLNL